MAFEIAKAGWMFRQSSVLRRWKKNWFVLYQDGFLRYFESPDDHTAEEAYLMKAKCLSITCGLNVSDVEPPAGHGRSCLLQITFTDTTLTLCAESPDDMQAWQISLEEARNMQVAHNVQMPPPYPGYTGVPGQTLVYHYAGHQPPAYVINGAPGQTTVVYTEPRRYYRRGYDGVDVATGMLAGAAIGTMMWGPLLWW